MMEKFGEVVAIAIGAVVFFCIGVTSYWLNVNTWKCTNTKTVGTSPHRVEHCVQYAEDGQTK